jgi:hypothetical protein
MELCTACEMSVSRASGAITAMPACRAASQAADSARSASVTAPTGRVTAASPCQPSRMAPQSTEIRSPSASTCSADGMPCTICSFTEAQMVAGKPW